MKLPIIGAAIDERFLQHRLRSTSIGGVCGGILAAGLFGYHYYHDHVWNWELFSIGAVMAFVKQGLMVWYRRTN